ncbi:MAG TPA: efflux RND transporter permease subunit [Candidatus Limnocylindrales bacterium]|nr:efflux RND transporter permease subunit [Candidatus Limnocylindrales bacterium]
MSRLSAFAVSKRSVTLLLAGALFVAGLLAWGNLKQELLPDIEFPVITVVAPLPGAGAADVADQVTKPIEQAIAGVPRLESVQSTSANSLALVVAQFSFGSDVKEIRAAIEQNLQNVGLPATVNPQVTALNINASPVIIASIAATSEDGLTDAARVAQEDIKPALLAIDGVGSVDITGGEEQRVLVTLDPEKLTANGISVSQVTGVLAANNLTFPSGEITTDTSQISVSTIGRIESVDAVEDLVVGVATAPGAGAPGAPSGPVAASGAPVASGAPAASGDPTGSAAPAGSAPAASPATTAPTPPTPVTIGDLGTVEIQGVATTGYARTNGQPALSLSVSKTSDANTVLVADAVTATLDEIAAQHTDVVSVTVVSDLSNFIKESRDGLLREGGLGALFAVLTIFLFLFSIRSTIVAAVSIPLSILTALVVMQVTGITLNIMTLGGLAVAVGRVVDDAIVVLENIYRHRALGEDRLTAAINGPKEVAGAITAATITTVGVFLPLGFVGGLVSQFFLPFALTVTFALLASLVCALTVVPVLAYLLIDKVPVNVDEDGEPKNSLWIRAYTPAIAFALRSRATRVGVVAVAIVLFVVTAALAPLLPTAFINAGSENIVQATIAPPPGASTEAVLAHTQQAEEILAQDPNVVLVQTSIPGEGEAGFQTITAAMSGRPANSARMAIRLVDTVDLTEYAQTLSDALAPVKTDGFDVAIAQLAGFSSNNLSVVVSGDNPTEVATANDAVLAALADNADLLNLKSDLSAGTPEIQVTPDPNKSIMVGLTAAQVAQEVRSALVGSVATRVVIDDNGATADIFVELDPAAVASVEDLQALPVGTVAKAPLGTIAAVEEVDAQGSITRIDQSPAASISAEITSEDTGKVSKDVQAEIDALVAGGQVPQGVDVRLAGVTAQMDEAFGGLFFSMGVAILIVYVAMVLTFNSLITPFIILFSLPLATIGALPALYLTGRPLGVSALIGFLMLIGIVVTNAIVLLDLVERLRSQGMATHEALIEGGRTRVRPILMTAIATILALIPLAAGFNQGSIIAAELGTVVIGGLFSSTFLTLLVIPVIYSLVDGGRKGLSRRVRRSDEDEPSVVRPVVATGEAG